MFDSSKFTVLDQTETFDTALNLIEAAQGREKRLFTILSIFFKLRVLRPGRRIAFLLWCPHYRGDHCYRESLAAKGGAARAIERMIQMIWSEMSKREIFRYGGELKKGAAPSSPCFIPVPFLSLLPFSRCTFLPVVQSFCKGGSSPQSSWHPTVLAACHRLNKELRSLRPFGLPCFA